MNIHLRISTKFKQINSAVAIHCPHGKGKWALAASSGPLERCCGKVLSLVPSDTGAVGGTVRGVKRVSVGMGGG